MEDVAVVFLGGRKFVLQDKPDRFLYGMKKRLVVMLNSEDAATTFRHAREMKERNNKANMQHVTVFHFTSLHFISFHFTVQLSYHAVDSKRSNLQTVNIISIGRIPPVPGWKTEGKRSVLAETLARTLRFSAGCFDASQFKKHQRLTVDKMYQRDTKVLRDVSGRNLLPSTLVAWLRKVQKDKKRRQT